MNKRLNKIFPAFFGVLLCTCGVPIDVSAENVSVSAADIDQTQSVFRITMDDPAVPDLARVTFAVWGVSNGQNDIMWYEGQRMSDGSYQSEVRVSDHGETGDYEVHAYVQKTDGSLTLTGNTYFEVDGMGTAMDGDSDTDISAPSAVYAGVTASNYNPSNGTFQVRVSGIQSASGISQVQVPVWCSADQSDIRWYDASRMSDGSYGLEVSIANHGNHTGTYQIHAYVRENNGAFNIVGGTTQEVGTNGSNGYDSSHIGGTSEGALSVTDRNGDGTSYQVRLSGAQYPGMTGVLFAVWAEQGGQDDLRWYEASRSSDGSYTYAVSPGSHGQTGAYNVHAYAVLSNGEMQILTGTVFQTEDQGQSGAGSQSSANVQITNVNESAGTFNVIISNISVSGGIESVMVPIWHSPDQSDILWYAAQRQSNGTYTVSADIANHKGNRGSYHVHVYVTPRGGAMNCVCGTAVELNGSGNQGQDQNQNQNEDTRTVQATRISDSRYQISVSAPEVSGSSAKVLFPTWSDANGQDDIIWYEGIRSSEGIWYVEVDGAMHGSSGSFTTHAYKHANGQDILLGGVGYTISAAQQTRVVSDANAVIASVTNASMDSGEKLRACYNWAATQISYQTLPIPMEPAEPGYTQEEWYAIYGLEERRGNCYCYAAAFAAMARQLGYNATMISGSVPLLEGGWGPHAWVEIYMNGATYVCDPESQHENPNYGFYMTTYATAPYPYQK